jgi:hypothetical protein
VRLKQVANTVDEPQTGFYIRLSLVSVGNGGESVLTVEEYW